MRILYADGKKLQDGSGKIIKDYNKYIELLLFLRFADISFFIIRRQNSSHTKGGLLYAAGQAKGAGAGKTAKG